MSKNYLQLATNVIITRGRDKTEAKLGYDLESEADINKVYVVLDEGDYRFIKLNALMNSNKASFTIKIKDRTPNMTMVGFMKYFKGDSGSNVEGLILFHGKKVLSLRGNNQIKTGDSGKTTFEIKIKPLGVLGELQYAYVGEHDQSFNVKMSLNDNNFMFEGKCLVYRDSMDGDFKWKSNIAKIGEGAFNLKYNIATIPTALSPY